MAKELEKNLEKVSEEVSRAAEDVKDTMNEVGGRRNKSSIEEKVTTILGILLLLRGLRVLRRFIGGIILLLLGGLFVSGYFNRRLRPLFNPPRKTYKPAKEEKKKADSKKSPTKKKK